MMTRKSLLAFALGALMFFQAQAWEMPGVVTEELSLAFSQEQYEMLKRCSQKGDMTEWNEWADSNAGENISRDLRVPIRLQAADFRKANLLGAKLMSTDIREVILVKAKLDSDDIQGVLDFDEQIRLEEEQLKRLKEIKKTYRKPIIYLYPPQSTDVNATLDYKGVLKYTYPAYNGGWNVTAQPDGTLTNHADEREYSYLYWDGVSDTEWDFSKGFVVKGSDTVSFFQEKLAFIGLTPREYNEFIVYWLPHMQDSPWNLITFQEEHYTDSAVLTITPKPDAVLRVFMAYKPLQEPIDISEPTLKAFERKGFTVVEWGGSECE